MSFSHDNELKLRSFRRLKSYIATFSRPHLCAIPPTLVGRLFKNITIQRLLTMSVKGFPFRPQGESYLNYALSCPIQDVQSRIFNYSNYK